MRPLLLLAFCFVLASCSSFGAFEHPADEAPTTIQSSKAAKQLTCQGEVDISFYLIKDGYVTVTVYTHDSRRDVVLLQEWLSAGHHCCTYSAIGKPPGLYFCQIVTHDGAEGKSYITETIRIRVVGTSFHLSNTLVSF